MNEDFEESKNASCLNMQFEKEDENDERINNADTIFNKLKSALSKRRRYKANWFHMIFKIIPSCLLKYKGLLRK